MTAPERITTVTTYAGGASAVAFGLQLNEIAALVGAVVAVLSFGLNVWFKYNHLKLIRQAAEKKPDCATCPERKTT